MLTHAIAFFAGVGALYLVARLGARLARRLRDPMTVTENVQAHLKTPGGRIKERIE